MALIKDLTVFGASRFISDVYGNITYANKYITNGGSSSQFVKGDGTLDSNVYATTSSVDTLLNSHLSNYVPKQFNTRFYPFVKADDTRSTWHKVTFPWQGATLSQSDWIMTSMELVLSGNWQNGNIGRIYLQYAFTKNNSNVWSGDVRGIAIGYRILNNVIIKYDIANPGIMYVKTNSNGYNTFAIENLSANDTAINYDFRDTTITAISEDDIPSTATNTVTLYHAVTTQNYSDTTDSRYVKKTGDTMTGVLTATGFKKTDGTSSQFLKADGSVDSNVYATTASINTTLNSYVKKVTSTDNAIARFDGTGGQIQNSGVTINDSNHLTAAKLITSGGTSSQFVKGDGSLDSSQYATTSTLTSYVKKAGDTMTGALFVPTASSATDETKGINFGTSSSTGAHIGYSTLLGIYSDNAIYMRPNGASTSSAGNGSIEITNSGINVFEVVTAEGFKKTNGTSAQFLKADGSVDSNEYVTTNSYSSEQISIPSSVTLSNHIRYVQGQEIDFDENFANTVLGTSTTVTPSATLNNTNTSHKYWYNT